MSVGLGNKLYGKWAHVLRKFGLVSGTPLDRRPEIARIVKAGLQGVDGDPIADLSSAKAIRIRDNGCTNWVILCGGQRRLNTRFVLFPGARDNIVVIGASSDAPREMRFEASENLAIVGDDIRWCVVKMRFVSDQASVTLGRNSIFNGTDIIVEGQGCRVEVGEDGLFAPGTTIRSSDLHGIYDIQTGDWVNPPSSVKIEPHVWLGQDALVLKGAHIEGGSVIAARSVVSGQTPRYSVCAGSPAKPIRTGICWSLEREPHPEQHDEIDAKITNSAPGKGSPDGPGEHTDA